MTTLRIGPEAAVVQTLSDFGGLSLVKTSRRAVSSRVLFGTVVEMTRLGGSPC